MSESAYTFPAEDKLTFSAELFDNRTQYFRAFIIPSKYMLVNGNEVALGGEENVLAITQFGNRVVDTSIKRKYLLFFPKSQVFASCDQSGMITPYTGRAYGSADSPDVRYTISYDGWKYYCTGTSLKQTYAKALNSIKSRNVILNLNSVGKKFSVKSGEICTIIKQISDNEICNSPERQLFVGLIYDPNLAPPYTTRVYDAFGKLVDDEHSDYDIVEIANGKYFVVVTLNCEGSPMHSTIMTEKTPELKAARENPEKHLILEFTAKI
jgi:hypothetical protein